MAIFDNPNSPQQPHGGVYAWYAIREDTTLTLYVGKAGGNATCLTRGTLFRGVSELQRNTFTSNSPKYDALDTDFIVGTAIKYFEGKGYECVWKHVCDDPNQEKEIVGREKPVLQDEKGDILSRYKRVSSSSDQWRLTPALVSEAEDKLFQLLEQQE